MKTWDLCLEDGCLSSEDQVVRLTPKSAAVLACLARASGRVLTRGDILQDVWQGLAVSPDLVREHIFDIRKALGDEAANPSYIETVGRRGFRLIGPVRITSQSMTRPALSLEGRQEPLGHLDQRPAAKFSVSKDGTSIAHTVSGSGYPLLVAGSWMSHLDMDWDNPSYGAYLRHLTEKFQVIRYDQRGNGLSQWANVDISFDHLVDDMEEIVDAYGHEKVAILGMSQGASVAIAYAHRHPQRVSHLVFNGGYARGRKHRGTTAGLEESDALVSLIRHGWGNENPAIRQTLTTLFMPDATQDQMQWFNEFQRHCGPAQNIALFRETFDDMNVSQLLPKVKTPTLVLHSDKDSVAPLSEGKLLASRIPGCSFVQLNSANHMLFETESDFFRLIDSIVDFVHA